MLIIYYRLYITSTLTRVLFNLNQSNELKDTHKLEPLTKETLPPPQKLHHKAKRLQNIEEIEALFPEFKASKTQEQAEAQNSLQRQKKETHRENPANG
jgi:CRISPR/Cas system-associated endonuclease/helicase Cas3